MALHLVQDEEPVIDIESALAVYESLDSLIKDLTKVRDGLKVQIVGAMAFQSRKRVEVPSMTEGKKFRATYTAPERLKVDTKGIEQALGPRVFARVSTRVLDQDKLLVAIDKGKVDAEKVSPFITKTPGTPSVRFYLVDDKEEESDEGPAED